MKFVALLFFTSVGFVLCFHGKQQYPALENVYDTNIVSDAVAEDLDHKIFKKSINAHTPENEETPEGTVQEPCRVSLPTVDLSALEIPQDTYSDYDIQDTLPMGVAPPRVPSFPFNIPFNKWTPYDLDYLTEEPAQDYRVSYNSYNMPYIYSNPVPSVRSLPPVISTQIHETLSEIPETPEMEDVYDVDGFADNEMYFPPYVRAVRSRDDDYMEQLEKDAMIPNILPTMPFPYMRSASIPSYPAQYNPSYKPLSQGPIAVFAAGSGSNCALPFLLSCTPKISHGILKNAYGGSPTHSAPVTYRKDSKVGSTHGKAH